MNAVNAVQLFLLVWNLSTVCYGDTDVCSVRCDDANGTVGNEVTLTCRVSEQCNGDCIMFKFQYHENNKVSEICKQNGSCKKGNITCRYTPDTAMKETILFFMQTNALTIDKKFTVEISAGPMKSTAETEAPIKTEEDTHVGASKTHKEEKQDRGFKLAVVLSAVSCFIIVIIIIVLKVKKSKSTHLSLIRKENNSQSLDDV